MSRLSRIWILTRRAGVIAILPPTLLAVFLPTYAKNLVDRFQDVDLAYQIFLQRLEFFVPILAIWWPIVFLKDHVEGDGAEINLQREGRVYGRYAEVILCMLFYIALIFLIYVFLIPAFGLRWIDMSKTIVQSICFVSFLFFFSYLFRSVSLASLILIMYHVLLLFVELDIPFVSIYHKTPYVSVLEFTKGFSLILLISLIVFVLASYLSKEQEWK